MFNMLKIFKNNRKNNTNITIDIAENLGDSTMTRKEFCNLLKPIVDDEYFTESDAINNNDNIDEIVESIKKIENIEKFNQTNLPIKLKSGTISRRTSFCFRYSLHLLGQRKYKQSLHELHDSIQNYYENIHEKLNDIDYLLMELYIKK